MRILTSILFLVPLCAQQPPGGGPQAAKNLKILKPEEVMTVMRTFTSGLGVRCDFCHMQGDMASDANPHKVTARMMLSMTRDLNAAHFNGKERITCYTCHHGAQEPPSAPPAGGALPGR
jgi:hypothetical protein